MAKEIETTNKVIRRRFRGEVLGAKDKTINVLVKAKKMHPKYKKQYVVSKKYHVHDEKNQASVGDTVVFQECRPMSKTKRWRLTEIVS